MESWRNSKHEKERQIGRWKEIRRREAAFNNGGDWNEYMKFTEESKIQEDAYTLEQDRLEVINLKNIKTILQSARDNEYDKQRHELEKRYHLEQSLRASETYAISKSFDPDSSNEASRLKVGIRATLPHKRCRRGIKKCITCKNTTHNAYRSLLLTSIDDAVRFYILQWVTSIDSDKRE